MSSLVWCHAEDFGGAGGGVGVGVEGIEESMG